MKIYENESKKENKPNLVIKNKPKNLLKKNLIKII
jgi:hypothetical protein